MINKISRTRLRQIRHERLRKKIIGTDDRPRLAIFKSHRHLYAQVINDVIGNTLVSVSTLESGLKDVIQEKSTEEIARFLGETIAERAIKNGIEAVVFDRSGYKFHGTLVAFAEGARKKGLQF